MAFGFPPHVITSISLEGMTPKEFMALATQAVKDIGWTIGYLREDGLNARTRFSMSSWSEVVTIDVKSDRAEIKSECASFQLIDWGKNQRNVNRFIDQFKLLRNK